MATPLMLAVVLTGCAIAHAAAAGTPVTDRSKVARSAPAKNVVIPGTGHEVVFAGTSGSVTGVPPTPALLKAIVTWLGIEFGLPRSTTLPSIRLASSATITTIHHTGHPSERPQDLANVPPGQREVLAVYDPVTSTIYLPARWTGNSPAELSMLVHEMVHHLQHGARMQYECPQAGEQLAYAAQDQWLRLFGRDITADFELDPFTLFVSVRCI